MKARKKPIVIEAWYPGEYPIDAPIHSPHQEWINTFFENGLQTTCVHCGHFVLDHLLIDTIENTHLICPGDVLLKGVKGEWYSCKRDIFEQTYDIVEE